MKKNILSVSALFFTTILFAQSPGGVTSNNNLRLWLDASQLSLVNGAKVASWSDFSGGGNHATNSNTAKQPTYQTNQINGRPSVVFSSDLKTVLNTPAMASMNVGTITQFAVFDGSTPNHTGFVMVGKYSGYNQFIAINRTNGELRPWVIRPNSTTAANITTNSSSYQMLGNLYNASSGTFQSFKNGSSFGIKTGTTVVPSGNSLFTIGASPGGGSFNGGVAEIIMFSSALSSAERIIIENYLGAKYNLSIANDYYAYQATHSNQLIGLGQESDGGNYTAVSNSTMTISNMSTPTNGSYILIGHDGVGLTPANNFDIPNPGWARYGRVWRAGVTGTPGTITVTFDLSQYSLGFPDSYRLLVDNDGIFASGATEYPGIFDGNNQTVTFSGVSLADGNYIALANTDVNIFTTGVTNDWHLTTTWNCGCIPTFSSQVQILNGHNVFINGQNAKSGNLTIDGSLSFNSTDTLFLNQNITNNGTVNFGTATLAFTSTIDPQLFDGNFNFYNLYINNALGVSNNSGTSTVQGFLDVQLGSLTTNDAIIMLSNASGTGALKNPSVGTIIGNLTVQRYLNEGESWYLLASPLTNATIEDWNQAFEMQGFPGTEWTSTQYSSVYYFNETATGPSINEGYKKPTSTADVTTNTRGFEIYVGNDSYGNVPKTISQTGTPRLGSGIVINGTYTPNIGDPSQDGWNLVGNPYQAPVRYINVLKSGSYETAYRKRADGTSIILQNSYILAPGEAFWLKCTGGPCSLTFDAVDVHTTNTDSYNTREADVNEELAIKLNHEEGEDEVLVSFNEQATDDYDLGLDAYKLNNAFKNKPNLAIVNKENHHQYLGAYPNGFNGTIPLNIYTVNPSSEEKNLSLTFENVTYIKERNKALILEDRALNTFTSVTEGLKVEFVLNDQVSEPRFFLHVNSPLAVQKTDVSCYNQNNGKITLELDGSQTVDVVCYDESMNVVATRNQVSSTQDIVDLQPGTYRLEVLNTPFGTVSNVLTISQPNLINAAFDAVIPNQLENGFSSSIENDTLKATTQQLIDFTNSTSDATEYAWDFGDLSSSTLENPQHMYFNSGVYQVKMIAKNGSCESDSYKYIQVDETTSINETNLFDEVNVIVKENNLNVLMNNNYSGVVSFEVLNSLGQTVYSSSKQIASNHIEEIKLNVASGVYMLKIDGLNNSKTKKIVLN
ncbi:MAG: T9SS type A sorting domain-containing protein [Flavobacteriales bacterium]|nr:T9SS type A sorting domain-containing protein [Flavobacteriales bacterium]